MAEELHIGDVGTAIVVTVTEDDDIVDVSSASAITFYFMKPGCDTVTKTGSLYTDGTDGKVKYVTEASFLNEVGMWKYQVKVVIGSNSWYSEQGSFKVLENIV